jgi:hypothetical protein
MSIPPEATVTGEVNQKTQFKLMLCLCIILGCVVFGESAIIYGQNQVIHGLMSTNAFPSGTRTSVIGPNVKGELELSTDVVFRAAWYGYPDTNPTFHTPLANVSITLYYYINMSKVGTVVTNANGIAEFKFPSASKYYAYIVFYDYRSSDHPGVEISRQWYIVDTVNSGTTDNMDLIFAPLLWPTHP